MYSLLKKILAALFILFSSFQMSTCSVGYFETYGWPSYGIVKPFWMTPFSSHPSRPMTTYARKHIVRSAGTIVGPRY